MRKRLPCNDSLKATKKIQTQKVEHMTEETINARINAISNALTVLEEIKGGLDYEEITYKDDIKAHKWLEKYLKKLEKKYLKISGNLKNRTHVNQKTKSKEV